MRTAMVQSMVRPLVRPMVNSEVVNRYPYLFNFNRKLLALPEILRRLNATYTRNSEKRVVQDGALVTLSANQFGTSYDPVTGLYGYVPEPAATNLALHSSSYSTPNAWDITTSTVVSATGTAPDGTATATLMSDNRGGTAVHYLGRSVSYTSGTSYSLSWFFRAGSGSGYVMLGLPSTAFPATARRAVFNLATGSVHAVESGVGAIITPVGGGWYRCAISATANATASGPAAFAFSPTGAYSESYNGTGANTLYAWGAQVETGLRATSHIATTGSTATRAADVLSVPLANIPGFNSAGYTLFADGRHAVDSSVNRGACAVTDGTPANNIVTLRKSAGNLVGMACNSGGVGQAAITMTNPLPNRFRAATSATVNNFAIAMNGAAGAMDTSGSMPVAPTTLLIGSQSTTEQFNGYLFRAGLIPQALTQEQINGLTA